MNLPQFLDNTHRVDNLRLVGPLEHFELISQVTDELNCIFPIQDIFLILLVQFVFPILLLVVVLLPLELILILV